MYWGVVKGLGVVDGGGVFKAHHTHTYIHTHDTYIYIHTYRNDFLLLYHRIHTYAHTYMKNSHLRFMFQKCQCMNVCASC